MVLFPLGLVSVVERMVQVLAGATLILPPFADTEGACLDAFLVLVGSSFYQEAVVTSWSAGR